MQHQEETWSKWL